MAQNLEGDIEKEKQNYLDSIVFFPGSVQEYEKMRGYSVKIVDLGFRDKGISFYDDGNNWRIDVPGMNSKKFEKVIENNIEAIVNCQYSGRIKYGLPVAKLENPPVSQPPQTP